MHLFLLGEESPQLVRVARSLVYSGWTCRWMDQTIWVGSPDTRRYLRAQAKQMQAADAVLVWKVLGKEQLACLRSMCQLTGLRLVLLEDVERTDPEDLNGLDKISLTQWK